MRMSIGAMSLLVLLLACDKDPEPGKLQCGPLKCPGDEVCVEDRFDPVCTNLEAGGVCPQGQTQGQCGGIGVDCCCPPDPPSEYRCEPAGECGDELLCTCLGMICPDNKSCMQLDEGSPLFACESPPDV